MKFPVVVKARRLSGSRGVIRADDSDALLHAVHQVRAIQLRADRDAQALGLIVEDFIPGCEHALEGYLDQGELTTLALFDKPDPLDGPYFEETLYVTPSRLQGSLQQRIRDEVARACRAAGLATGPVHAEMRVNERGVWLLEIAARSIGGLCARVLRHSLGMSLEELILRQLVGEAVAPACAVAGGDAAGVMMIPIPRRGIYHGVEGLAAAQSVARVTGVTITAQPGQIVAPPPDAASYLGFIFARASTPADAEAVLRSAHRCLHLDIRPSTRQCLPRLDALSPRRDASAVSASRRAHAGSPLATSSRRLDRPSRHGQPLSSASNASGPSSIRTARCRNARERCGRAR